MVPIALYSLCLSLLPVKQSRAHFQEDQIFSGRQFTLLFVLLTVTLSSSLSLFSFSAWALKEERVKRLVSKYHTPPLFSPQLECRSHGEAGIVPLYLTKFLPEGDSNKEKLHDQAIPQI
jgi:hypothetical protein